MKPFYTQSVSRTASEPFVRGLPPRASKAPSTGPRAARIALYHAGTDAPEVQDVPHAEAAAYIEALSSRIYELAREEGSDIPYMVIRELTENFIHAEFREPVVSIMDSGRTLRFADQGPGIADKERAMKRGFTTARGDMKRFIRGVGSGLPIVSQYLAACEGTIAIEDNLGAGSVITISVPQPVERVLPEVMVASDLLSASRSEDPELLVSDMELIRLTGRQKQVLALVVDAGIAGPSAVADELGVGVSTAYRDLSRLEELGLIEASEGGKRSVTPVGLSYLDRLMHG